jgi:hypothetical protein
MKNYDEIDLGLFSWSNSGKIDFRGMNFDFSIVMIFISNASLPKLEN